MPESEKGDAKAGVADAIKEISVSDERLRNVEPHHLEGGGGDYCYQRPHRHRSQYHS